MESIRELVGWGGVPVVIALVEATKLVFPELDRRWLPVVALVLSEMWSVATALALGQPLGEAAIMGVLVGLSSIGLFSGARAVTGR